MTSAAHAIMGTTVLRVRRSCVLAKVKICTWLRMQTVAVMTGFAQTMETVIVTLACVPPVTMATTMEIRKRVNSSTVQPRRMAQWMRSAVGMEAVTPFAASARVKRASLDQGVRTSLVPIVMVSCTHTPQPMHVTDAGLVM